MSHSVNFVLLESVKDGSSLASQCEEENDAIVDASCFLFVEAMRVHCVTIVNHADNDVKNVVGPLIITGSSCKRRQNFTWDIMDRMNALNFSGGVRSC